MEVVGGGGGGGGGGGEGVHAALTCTPTRMHAPTLRLRWLWAVCLDGATVHCPVVSLHVCSVCWGKGVDKSWPWHFVHACV